jgi:DNA repair protein RecN (Recombination protein N)
VGEKFARDVQTSLAALALSKCEFSVQLLRSATADGLGPFGFDDIEFYFTANPGEPPRPLVKVASGGEASRVLLALRQVLAGSDGCQTYILDEADSGVGGAVAEAVGRMMKEVSQHRQVLCITHQPQVAAFADEHLLVQKKHRQGRTTSEVKMLSTRESRTHELARMLSGMEVSKEALAAAEALVRSALKTVKKNTRPFSQSRRREEFSDVAAAV